MNQQSELIAAIDTGKGKIRLRLFADQVPVTVGSFVNLSNRGYYNGLKFHRVLDNFMIQGGCPYGNGTGGPGYKFEDEFVPGLRHHKPGLLSMANAGPGTNGSQFFITHVPTPWLDDKHTIFGEILGDEDQNVVNSIAQGDKILSITIEGDVAWLMQQIQSRVREWDEQLNRNFPHLAK
jgi:peptidyl-prolyl cis-trans isomerase B (cyclophilin B)